MAFGGGYLYEQLRMGKVEGAEEALPAIGNGVQSNYEIAPLAGAFLAGVAAGAAAYKAGK